MTNTTQNSMQEQQLSSYLFGANAAYIEELYEQYLKDPASVSAEWQKYFASLNKSGKDISHADIRAYFQTLAKQPLTRSAGPVQKPQKQTQVSKLIDAFRRYGHFRAQLDPLGLAEQRFMPDLDLVYHGLSSADLDTNYNSDGLFPDVTSLKTICAGLEETYCHTIGFEYMHISDQTQTEWLRHRIESVKGKFNFSADLRKQVLQHLIEAEGLEKYFAGKYVGQTRFSLEGGDSLIPLLDELIQHADSHGVKEVILGMGHRGRLNVLVNILGKAPGEICQEFEGKKAKQQGSGDVKYHMGFASNISTPSGLIHLAMGFNPSHLESIDPMVEGSVRARQQRRKDKEFSQVVPVLIHGDAAFAGQGIVMETFNLSQTMGYKTGGTIHIVVNNQIGFTTDASDARSSWYCTDVAKMVEAPIFHVNADDPDAVVFVTLLALDFRMQFKKDVVIDLVCYRRLGHNEGDEPAATQPLMYQCIRQHPTTLKLYAGRLIADGVITENEVAAQVAQYRDVLDVGKEIVARHKNHDQYAVNWKPYLDHEWTTSAQTAVSLEQLRAMADNLEKIPADFTLQPQVVKLMADRHKMITGEIPVDWGFAETLAYGSLLNEGYSVRISGQDVGRGTFYHRHAVLHDFKTGEEFIPLKKAEKNSDFNIYNSILSELAVMGFEYGYASSSPETLVIWEAQYGDFVNGAQVIIDQFISSAEQKWGSRLCGLTLLLPHGYEGAGPEHSSARLERFLQLCAQQNMQVCVPSNAAQIFHLLRRQMVRPFRKPLITMTPKSLLRLELAKSSLHELTEGGFQLIIPEIDDIKVDTARRVILCCGKVYYDLLQQRRANKQNDIAIIRVEQLYPFPVEELTAELQRYKKTKDIVWCQEEPQNQGTWYSMQHNFIACLAKGQTLRYVGREASASAAAGSKSLHLEQQKAFVDEALN